MMINVTELKRKVIDEFLISQPLVTNTPFKSVAKIYTGESTNAEEKNKYSVKTDDCYPYVSTKDISIKGSVNFENGMYIPKGEKKFSIAPVNSILLCIEGGNAGNKIAIIKEATCFVNKLYCFDIFGADNRFIYYYLLSNQFRNNFKEQMTGLIGGVSVKKLKELILPLPHITEQKRIADKLDEIFAELDKIDEKQIVFQSAIELVHNASLIHDDVIDESQSRRAVQTINSKFGNKLAVITGDYLLSVALKKIRTLDAPEIIDMFAQTLDDMCQGEIKQDFSRFKIPSIEEYLEKTRLKTAKLFETAICGSFFLAKHLITKLSLLAPTGRGCHKVTGEGCKHFNNSKKESQCQIIHQIC